MGRRIGLTTRVVDATGYSEPRDALAQDWSWFMAAAMPEVQWLAIPNLGPAVLSFLHDWGIDGVILTGGNDIGENPLRDATEAAILAHCLQRRIPVLGICRGLQMIQTFFGGPLQACARDRHVARDHRIRFLDDSPLWLPERETGTVNSYHGQAVVAADLAAPLRPFALTDDGLAEGIYHPEAPILAIQWHPERYHPLNPQDVALVRSAFALTEEQFTMRGIILAAGRGSRMKGLTDDRPKCLTILAGKPLLQWQLDALRAAGIGRIGVVRGYLAEMLSGPGYETFDNPRWSTTNMVMSLASAAPWLRSAPCIVSYADIVYRPDTVTALAGSHGDIVVAYDRLWRPLWSDRFSDPLADAETFQADATGRITEIGGRADSLDEIEGQYMGLLKFTPAGWRQVEDYLAQRSPEERDRLDMTSLLRGLIRSGVTVLGLPVNGGWCEVDSESDLRLYERKLHQSDWPHRWTE